MIGKPRQSKVGNALYEQVVARNFQTIEHFLTKFHEIFLKQDQFESALGKIQHRINLVERNNKKLEQTLNKSTDIYERKMNSLKQFILEKIKTPVQKVQKVQQEAPIIPPTAFENLINQEIMNQYQKQTHQSKKFEQAVTQHIKKLQYQFSSINQRINSLTMLTNNIDQRVGTTLKLNSNNVQERPSALLKEIQANLTAYIQEINLKLENNIGLFKEEISSLEKNFTNNFLQQVKKIKELEEIFPTKLSIEEFNQYKENCKEDEACLLQQITEAFANKKQTKKMLNLLEKKILKLEVIEQIVEQNDENRENISVVPAYIYNKPSTSSIHSRKAQKRKISQVKPHESMVIRKLNKKNFMYQKL